LEVGVGVLFYDQSLCGCPLFDADSDGRVTAADLIRAVGVAVAGCPA
jgi:hypothetical protein